MLPTSFVHSGAFAPAPAAEISADVIILGAGISGLACAATLRSAGLRVIVLEARHRVGGRLHTVSMTANGGRSSYAVDLGAAWVHGIGSAGAPNQLYSLACELNLGCRSTDYTDAAVYTADGLRLSDRTVADIEQLYHGFEEHLLALLHAPDPRLALMPIQAALDAFSASRGLSAAQCAQLSFAVSNHMEHYWAGEARCMGVAALDEVVLPGGDVVLRGGYGRIAERLAAGLDVRLGHEVVAVQYGGGGAGDGGAAPGVTVTARVTAPGDGGGGGGVVQLNARAAVVTLPLGVLRSGRPEFSPPLAAVDPTKAAAITGLGVAVYNKVVMMYDPADVFWDDTAFIYRIPAPYEAGRWSYFLNLYKVAGVPILIAFNLGQSAVALEAASDQEAVEGAMRALAGLYGEARVRWPRQAVVTRWGSDPHSRMSYTYVPAGMTGAAFDDLARPVLGCLFFAGEATHRRHYGTAHGAYDSGRQAAAAILQQLAAASTPRPQGPKRPMGRLAAMPVLPAPRPVRTSPHPSTARWRTYIEGSWRGPSAATSTSAAASVVTVVGAGFAGGAAALAAPAAAICLAPTGGIQPAAASGAVGSDPGTPPGPALERSDGALSGEPGDRAAAHHHDEEEEEEEEEEGAAVPSGADTAAEGARTATHAASHRSKL